ncbi:MarR family winged helix-turn-helix transcriptional regulator [Corynebacterium kalidii]|uniref:MarR family transcriptional regulator n=1 Tax=Corynebacterium kalidii TaxID=2931982 RepID=A0A9X2AZS2_9CORY|nr:MarR family transcriptional regulator [Corynebacterium kalidii]
MTDNDAATHTPAYVPTEDDNQLAHRFRDALREGLHMVRLLDHRGSLTLTQLGILNTLVEEPHSIGHLARINGMTQPGMTQQIDKLERLGVVRRVRSPRDARVTLVEITEEGRETRIRDNGLRNRALAEHFDLLDEDGRRRIADALEPLTNFASSYIRRVSDDSQKNDTPRNTERHDRE